MSKAEIKKLVLFIVIANIYDICATHYLIDTGLFYEINFLVELLYNAIGSMLLATTIPKLLFMCWLPLVLLFENANKYILDMYKTIGIVYGCLTIWHTFLIIYTIV